MKSKLYTLSFFIALLSIYFGFIYIYNFSIITFFKSLLFNDSVSEHKHVKSFTIFTKDQLKQYNGHDKKDLYLSILGNVYDVTKAGKHYGPGQTYHIFIGKDASKSFITGNFNDENVSDDISDLKAQELLSLKDWKKFYDKDYTKKGVLIGRYFDANGNPTEYSKNIDKLIKEAEKINDEKQLDDQKYPPCNIEWNPESGTKVWCTKQSGGINRNWIGVPRKYFTAGASEYRCACVKNLDDPKLRQFENCDPNALSCNVVID